MAKKPEVYALRVVLDTRDAERLAEAVPGAASLAEKLGSLAATALSDLAGGGLLVDPATVEEIRRRGVELSYGRDLIPAIEQARGYADGQVAGQWRLDPVWAPRLQEIAARQGVSVQELVQRIIDEIMGRGWIYDVEPDDGRTLHVTAADEKLLEEILGRKGITGSDVVAYLRSLTETPV